jgi:hypothetical protein
MPVRNENIKNAVNVVFTCVFYGEKIPSESLASIISLYHWSMSTTQKNICTVALCFGVIFAMHVRQAADKWCLQN